MLDPLIQESMFHATPYWNIDPILKRGIDPQMSRGQLPFSWYVSGEHVRWSIGHVAYKYCIEVHEVVVFEVVEKPRAFFFIAPKIGAFRSGLLLRPSAMYPAYNWYPLEV